MNILITVLHAVAEELAKEAISAMPKLNNEERVLREWFENDTFYRETSFNGERNVCKFSFTQREFEVCNH